MLSLKEAAEAVGMGKPGLLKAIQKGRISAQKNALGEWQIDPAELHRVYKPVPVAPLPKEQIQRQEALPHEQEIALLRRDLEHAAEKIESLKVDLERERRKDAETIDDLRRRLDDTEAKRERATAQLTALLSDQRAKAEPEPVPRKRGWLNWR